MAVKGDIFQVILFPVSSPTTMTSTPMALTARAAAYVSVLLLLRPSVMTRAKLGASGRSPFSTVNMVDIMFRASDVLVVPPLGTEIFRSVMYCWSPFTRLLLGTGNYGFRREVAFYEVLIIYGYTGVVVFDGVFYKRDDPWGLESMDSIDRWGKFNSYTGVAL